MGLLDLLKNPNSYRVGGGSKELDYPGTKHGLSQGPLLGKRVSFDITDKNADPTFEIGDNYGRTTIDQFVRGGTKYAEEARTTDFDRINKFLYETPNGELFLQKQVTLQALNPQPQKLYNYGVNTLASVAAAGVSNVRRGGLLPSVGGFDLGALIGIEGGTYVGVVGDEGGLKLREQKYGLGDPGKPSSTNALDKLIDINPFKKKSGYDVYISTAVDKVNILPVLDIPTSIPTSFLGAAAKDFIPFKFQILNQYNPQSHKHIIFRAFLDSISDDYNATHNSYKYNGRGEEFYTYNKFARKIQVSFKIAAQTRFEMKPLYQKLNYLVAQTAPNYSPEGRIVTPYCALTVGDWFNNIPGLITNVGLTWQKDYPWEIALDREISSKTGEIRGKDKDMLMLPHVLDVNLSFQPIHAFTPNNSETAPFIGIDGGEGFWLENATKVTELKSGDEVVGGSYTQKMVRQGDQVNIVNPESGVIDQWGSEMTHNFSNSPYDQ